MRNILLAITPGDPKGIGPEIVWKAIRTGLFHKRGIRLLCIGARLPFEQLKNPTPEIIEVSELSDLNFCKLTPKQSTVYLLPAPESPPDSNLLLEGFQSGWAIQKATQLIQQGFVNALVTGPISKERLQRGGFLYPGHTEFLADLCKLPTSRGKPRLEDADRSPPSTTPSVTMMLANEQLRISLVTTHLSLKDVPTAITREKIRRAVSQTAENLQNFWGIQTPKIAITSLNPHAGEAGRLGREEIEIIQPEISHLKRIYRKKIEIHGPFPADTLFAKHILSLKKDRWDAVVCMYHDQGLIPVKLLDFKKTVNITLGLPIIRTSVDHGVGFDIAGKGIADPSSLIAAIDLAASMVKKRQSLAFQKKKKTRWVEK